ncbi:hypothetical protein ACFSW9_18985, partial [Sphingopyxis terrae subsp. ummariensis]
MRGAVHESWARAGADPPREQLQSGVGEAFAKLRDSCTLLKHEVEEAPFTLACPGSLLARWLIPRLDA